MPFIVSALPGRIRIRHKLLARAGHGAALSSAFQALAGVTRVEHKAEAASLVIFYDADQVPPEALEALVDEIVATEMRALAAQPGKKQALNRYAKYGMLLSLSISLALAASGQKKGHALAGAAFVACLGIHLMQHRQRLLV